MYITCYEAKKERNRNYEIFYRVIEKQNVFYLEAEIAGTEKKSLAYLGDCGIEKAEQTAKLIAGNALHPVHLEEVLTDMRF